MIKIWQKNINNKKLCKKKISNSRLIWIWRSPWKLTKSVASQTSHLYYNCLKFCYIDKIKWATQTDHISLFLYYSILYTNFCCCWYFGFQSAKHVIASSMLRKLLNRKSLTAYIEIREHFKSATSYHM